MSIEFFGAVDRQEDTGNIRSQYPGWFFDNQIEELKEDIDKRKRSLDKGIIPLDVLPDYEANLERDKKRYDDIVNSRPDLTEEDRDKLAKRRTVLGNRIAESMFTNTDMDMGYASPNEEARRMVEPCIDVKRDDIEYVESMGIEPVDGKISRNQATKVWQIMSKALDEDTNVEILRKPGKAGRTKQYRMR